MPVGYEKIKTTPIFMAWRSQCVSLKINVSRALSLKMQ